MKIANPQKQECFSPSHNRPFAYTHLLFAFPPEAYHFFVKL